MIKQMVMEYIYMQMEQNMKVNGKMIYSVDMVLKHGVMDQDMKDTIRVAKRMAKVYFSFEDLD